MRHLYGKPCLADAGCSHQCHQAPPGMEEVITCRLLILLAPYEGGEHVGKVGLAQECVSPGGAQGHLARCRRSRRMRRLPRPCEDDEGLALITWDLKIVCKQQSHLSR